MFIAILSNIHYLHILDHWAASYCFVELLGDPSTTLFHHHLILFFRYQLNGAKGEDGTYWRHAEWVRQSSSLHFFIFLAAFVPFFLIVSMVCLQVYKLDIQVNISVLERKYAFEDTKPIEI